MKFNETPPAVDYQKMDFAQENSRQFEGRGKEKIKAFIEKLDITVLKDILIKILEKSGASTEKLEKLSKEVFLLVESSPIDIKNAEAGTWRLATYYGGKNVIHLRPEIIEMVKGEGLSEEGLLLTLVHEIVHLASSQSYKETVVLGHMLVAKDRVGLDEIHKGILVKNTHKNILLNEGLTQLVAEAVTVEYFRRKGYKGVDEKEFQSYSLVGKQLVTFLVKSIAVKTSTPPDIVFKALIRSMLNYDYNEFKSSLGEEIGLLELVKKIEEVSIEGQTMNYPRIQDLINQLGSEEFRSIAQSINPEEYFNPLIGSLG